MTTSAEPRFVPISQDDFLRDIATLGEAIAADPGWNPDFLVGIGRGGLVPATAYLVAVILLGTSLAAGVLAPRKKPDANARGALNGKDSLLRSGR